MYGTSGEVVPCGTLSVDSVGDIIELTPTIQELVTKISVHWML